MIRTLAATVLALATTSLFAEDDFKPLLNGTDLSGWKSIRAESDAGKSSFSYNEESQSIHVYAGEEAGSEQPIDCLYTEEEYSHYVLKMEYRWLDKRFEPRLTHDRDGGLLFHVHGNLNKIWPKCVEMQLGESDPEKVKDRYVTGDLWVIGKDIQVMNARDEKDFYSPENKLVPVGKDQGYDKSFIKVQNEKPHGEWNEITLTIRGGQEAIYELNGKVVNRITDLSHEVDCIRSPLKSGRIGLQAEYAELEYRNIRVKELPSE